MIKVTVVGRPNYYARTLYSWCLELRDFLREDLGREIEVRLVEGDSPLPQLYVCGKLAFEGLPGEEGYLIELIKHAVDELSKPCSSP